MCGVSWTTKTIVLAFLHTANKTTCHLSFTSRVYNLMATLGLHALAGTVSHNVKQTFNESSCY